MKIEYEPETRGNYFVARIEYSNIQNIFSEFRLSSKDEIKRTILRGCFLGAGSCTNPEKSYHLEIIFEDKKNSDYILNLSKDFGIEFKEILLKNKYMLYLKDSEQVSNLLA